MANAFGIRFSNLLAGYCKLKKGVNEMDTIKFRLRVKCHDIGQGESTGFTVLTLSELLATHLIGEVLSVDLFTGLHDKTGKEIFEGDIVKSGFRLPGHEIYVVEYYQRNAEFTIQPQEVCEKVVEIIGNIYENPKLVE